MKEKGALMSFESTKTRRNTMRLKADPQRYFDWSVASRAKVVLEYEEKYDRISALLDENPLFVDLIHRDLKPLSKVRPQNRRGRNADFTSENILRALIVHQIEGTSLRDTVVRISHSPFLQQFLRLGVRRVMDFTFLDKCFKLIEAETWRRLNEALWAYAVEQGQLDDSRLRVDTTVVEANIRWPTDSSLLWDSWRTLYRLFKEVREIKPTAIPHRFHRKKAKRLHLLITRYASSPSKRRQRVVRHCQRELLLEVGGSPTLLGTSSKGPRPRRTQFWRTWSRRSRASSRRSRKSMRLRRVTVSYFEIPMAIRPPSFPRSAAGFGSRPCRSWRGAARHSPSDRFVGGCAT